MKRFYILVTIVLNNFAKVGNCVSSNEGISSSSSSQTELPDLNIPLAEEAPIESSTSQTAATIHTSPTTKTKHASKIKFHAKKGSLAAFREKERERLRLYRATLPKEKKKAQTRKVMQRRMHIRKDLSPRSQASHELLKKNARAAYYRRHARLKAEKEGKIVPPELAIRKPGRKIKPLPPSN